MYISIVDFTLSFIGAIASEEDDARPDERISRSVALARRMRRLSTSAVPLRRALHVHEVRNGTSSWASKDAR